MVGGQHRQTFFQQELDHRVRPPVKLRVHDRLWSRRGSGSEATQLVVVQAVVARGSRRCGMEAVVQSVEVSEPSRKVTRQVQDGFVQVTQGINDAWLNASSSLCSKTFEELRV